MSDPASDHPLADDLAAILTQTRGSWERLRGQSIFITGGTGFFGRWLLESFAHADQALGLSATLVVLSRDPAAFLVHAPRFADHPSIRFVAGDVGTFTAAEVHRQLAEETPRKFRYVIHAATDTSAAVQAAHPLRLMETVVQGTRSALDFAVAAGAQRFLLTSSGAVYGRQPAAVTHVAEDYPGAPDTTLPGSVYGEGKRMAEVLCACYHREYGLETLIARCFAFVGPFLSLNAHFAVGNFIRDALLGGPIKIAGDGSPFRSYLYAADLAAWLWTILCEGEPARPYNVGSGEDLDILELARTVTALLNTAGRVEVALPRQEGAPPSRYVPSIRRAESELRLGVNVSLSEAIVKTARWACAHDLCVRKAV